MKSHKAKEILLHNTLESNSLESNSLESRSHLLVKCETSPQKQQLINAFKEFELKHGIDCSRVIEGIHKHEQYITNGRYYFLHNSKLSFLQKFRSKREDVLKLLDFFNSFNNPYFWHITKKTTILQGILFKPGKKKTKIEFTEINVMDNNLRQLLWRLNKYGYEIPKYIIVPEIKESKGLFNYHYHMLLEPQINIEKITSNKNPKYKNLVYDLKQNKNIDTGWINNPVLSQIWKDITKDGSYRIKPEEIRSRKGAFHYILSYMNKGMEFESVSTVPYMYYALKSRKAYRIKGIKKMPKIKFKAYTPEGAEINMNFFNINFIQKEDIPIDKQEYVLCTYKNDKLISRKRILQNFINGNKQENNGNQLLSNFDIKLQKSRIVFEEKNNWQTVEQTFTQQELTKMLEEGIIYETKEGYKLL